MDALRRKRAAKYNGMGGYLLLRNDHELVRYYFRIDYPDLCYYPEKTSHTPTGLISLQCSGRSQSGVSLQGDLGLELRVESGRFQLKAESEPGVLRWFEALTRILEPIQAERSFMGVDLQEKVTREVSTNKLRAGPLSHVVHFSVVDYYAIFESPRLLLYKDKRDERPERTMLLSNCAVEIDKKNMKQFSVTLTNESVHYFRCRTEAQAKTWVAAIAPLQVSAPLLGSGGEGSRDASSSSTATLTSDPVDAATKKKRRRSRNKMKLSSVTNLFSLKGSKSTDHVEPEECSKCQVYASRCFDLTMLKHDGHFSDEFHAQDIAGAPGESDELELSGMYKCICGSLEDLVEWVLFHCAVKHGNNADWHALLLCYRDMFSVRDLLLAMEDVWQRHQSHGFPKDIGLAGMRSRLENMAEQWMRSWPNDLNDPEHERRFFEFLSTALGNDVSMKIKELWCEVHDELRRGSIVCTSDGAMQFDADYILREDAEVFAMSLTEQSARLYSQILPSELLELKWQKEPESTPGMKAFCESFNAVATWITKLLLTACDPKTRAALYNKFTEIWSVLFKLRNYSGCVQVFSALTHSAFVRVIKEFECLIEPRSKEVIAQASQLFTPMSNYKNYRPLPHDPPTLPFLAVYARDLTFICDGNPKRVARDAINLERMRMLSSCIMERLGLRDPLQTTFEFPIGQLNEDLIAYLNQLKPLDDLDLYELSYSIKASNTPQRPPATPSPPKARPASEASWVAHGKLRAEEDTQRRATFSEQPEERVLGSSLGLTTSDAEGDGGGGGAAAAVPSACNGSAGWISVKGNRTQPPGKFLVRSRASTVGEAGRPGSVSPRGSGLSEEDVFIPGIVDDALEGEVVRGSSESEEQSGSSEDDDDDAHTARTARPLRSQGSWAVRMDDLRDDDDYMPGK